MLTALANHTYYVLDSEIQFTTHHSSWSLSRPVRKT